MEEGIFDFEEEEEKQKTRDPPPKGIPLDSPPAKWVVEDKEENIPELWLLRAAGNLHFLKNSYSNKK